MANILVPFDFSSNALVALDQAILLAADAAHSIEVLHITNTVVAHDYPAVWKENPAHKSIDFLQEKLDAIIKERADLLGNGHAAVVGIVVESGIVNGALINQALLNNATLIVMGTHGATNAMNRFWGSNTSALVNHAIFPILAIPRTWKAADFNQLVAAVSLNEINKCMGEITKWSEFMHASAELVCISSLPDSEQRVFDETLAGFPHVRGNLLARNNSVPLWKNLVELTSHYELALLLMFVHERTVLEKLFNYSITSKVVDGIHIPLLAVPTSHK